MESEITEEFIIQLNHKRQKLQTLFDVFDPKEVSKMDDLNSCREWIENVTLYSFELSSMLNTEILESIIEIKQSAQKVETLYDKLHDLEYENS